MTRMQDRPKGTGMITLKFTRITNLYQVSAVLGAPSPWFDTSHPTHLLDQVFPFDGDDGHHGQVGAYVVERTPPERSQVAKIKPSQRERDRGFFQVLRVTLDGRFQKVGKVYVNRSSALYAADARAAGTWTDRQS